MSARICRVCDIIEQYGNLGRRRCKLCFKDVRGDFLYCDDCSNKEDLCYVCGKNWQWNKDCICNMDETKKLVKYCRVCNRYVDRDVMCNFCSSYPLGRDQREHTENISLKNSKGNAGIPGEVDEKTTGGGWSHWTQRLN